MKPYKNLATGTFSFQNLKTSIYRSILLGHELAHSL